MLQIIHCLIPGLKKTFQKLSLLQSLCKIVQSTPLGPTHGGNIKFWILNICRSVQRPNQRHSEIHSI
jgi:hypothetical protein